MFIEKPFCSWLIFERKPEFDESHNPVRFSLLYLCADGAAAYQALYLSNNIAPKFLCLINPGMGTDYYLENCLLHRSIKYDLKKVPDYLVTDSISRIYWSEYQNLVYNNFNLYIYKPIIYFIFYLFLIGF